MFTFTVNQPVLKSALADVVGVLEKKSTIPCLGFIKIKAAGEKTIQITGTDLDQSISVSCETLSQTEGVVCVDGRKFFEAVRLMDASAEISASAETNNRLTLKQKKSTYRFAVLDEDKFPETPEPPTKPQSISAHLLEYFITHTRFAITNDSSRFTLSGAKLEITKETILMVATDGHRLALCQRPNSSQTPDLNVLIPQKALTEIVKLIRSRKPADIGICVTANHFFVQIEDSVLLSTRLLTGTFPNYEMAIPKHLESEVTFDGNQLKKAIQRVALMADTRTQSVKVAVEDNTLQVSSISAEEGEASDVLDATQNGKNVVLAFNQKYLTDAIMMDIFAEGEEAKPIPDTPDILTLKYTDQLTQVIITNPTDDFLVVIMPLRV